MNDVISPTRGAKNMGGLGQRDKGQTGFKVLNVNVGSTTIETAEKFKQKD